MKRSLILFPLFCALKIRVCRSLKLMSFSSAAASAALAASAPACTKPAARRSGLAAPAFLPLIPTLILCSSTAIAQVDLSNGYYPSAPATAASIMQDDSLRAYPSERKHMLWKDLDRTKRSYQNLKTVRRAAYRMRTGEFITALWKRGAMNDLVRIITLTNEYRSWNGIIIHDRLGHMPLPMVSQIRIDERPVVTPELCELLHRLSATPPGYREIPLTNTEHLGYMLSEWGDAVAGLGSLNITYPRDESDVIRTRLQRFFKWGRFRDEELWKRKLKKFKRSLDARDGFDNLFATMITTFMEEMRNKLEDYDKSSLFEEKYKLFDSVWNADNTEGSINRAIDLIAQVEMLTKQLSGARNRRSKRLSRNQMAGISLRIGAAAKQFISSPCVSTVLRLGALGLIGTPILIDCNENGEPDLLDDSRLPDENVKTDALVSFDLDGDGYAESIEWYAPGADGLLCLDRNGNGRIDDGSELFGTAGGAADGFAALAALDADRDGKLSGNELDGLLIWFDDGDGVSGPEELENLGDWGVTSISLAHSMFASHCRRQGRRVKIWDWFTEIRH